MRRRITFGSIPKSPLNLSIPESLVKAFRERAKEELLKPNELATYIICELLGEDPCDYGLFPLKEQGRAEDPENDLCLDPRANL